MQGIRLDEMLTADSLAGWYGMQTSYLNCSLVVKIDVEGFEASVLKGMERLLREHRCRKVIVEENANRAMALNGEQDLTTYMAQFGYVPTVDSAGRHHFDQCYMPA